MTKFISEISSNHNGNLKRSLKMIKLSADIGFDIVKFQLFKIDKLFVKEILDKSKDIEKNLSNFFYFQRYF